MFKKRMSGGRDDQSLDLRELDPLKRGPERFLKVVVII